MKRINHLKKLLLVVACGAILYGSISTTVAWLSDSGTVDNQFEPGKVGCTVNETLDGAAKTDVSVTNGPNANVPAFIRVALVPVWRDADGNGTRYEAALPENLSLNLTSNGWFALGSYYYYKCPVPANSPTPVLINSCTAPAAPAGSSGLVYELQILAQSIQAGGTDAVEQVWPVEYDSATDTISAGS